MSDEPQLEQPGGDGIYRRRIALVAPDDTTVRADLEDDFHRFGLTLHHDGNHVVAIEGGAIRYPWSTCADAVEPLQAVVGTPLSPRAAAVADHAQPRTNCTHLFDLAGLAVAHAAAGRDRRQYDAAVPDRDENWRTRPRLSRDGEPILTWEIEGMTIVAPPLFAEVELRGGFLRWAESHLDPETAEAAAILRRACEISLGRQTPWDQFETAADVGDFMLGVCHTFTAGRAATALRIRGTIRDFTDRPQDLLADF